MLERSSGCIVFRLSDGKILYLLLHFKFKNEYWDFPKGAVEKDETEEEAALREVREETGIAAELLHGFRHEIKYVYRREGNVIFKAVIFFLAKAAASEVKESRESIGHEWLDCEAALKRLTFNNARETLKKAHAFLRERL